MVQVQFILDFQEGKNTIDLNILEWEDANDRERELARYIQDLHIGILEMAQAEVPGEIAITLIEEASAATTREGDDREVD